VSREPVLVVAILVLVPLLNFVVRVLRRHLPADAPQESGPKEPETPTRERTPPSSLGARRGEAGGMPPSVPQPLTEVLRPDGN
jgi:hypothetical protein